MFHRLVISLLRYMPRDRLIGCVRTPHFAFLLILFIYAIIRGIALISNIGYSAYQPEFDKIPREILGTGWLINAVLLWWGLWTRSYYVWRIGLITSAASLLLWASLFIINRGLFVFDAILLYLVFGILCLVVAMTSNDPRPIRKLRESIENAREF